MSGVEESLHAVVVACKHVRLQWLRPLCGQQGTSIFVYAKCGAIETLPSNCSNARVVPADNHGRDFKVYLTHVLRHHSALPAATFFVHDDFPKHLRLSSSGRYEFPAAANWREVARCYGFLSLKHPCIRQEVRWTPGRLCQRYRLGAAAGSGRSPGRPPRVNGSEVTRAMVALAADLLPQPLPPRLTFFESAQFVVSRERLARLPAAWYRRALSHVDAIGLDFAPIFAYERLFHLLMGCETSACTAAAAACSPRARKYAALYEQTALAAVPSGARGYCAGVGKLGCKSYCCRRGEL